MKLFAKKSTLAAIEAGEKLREEILNGGKLGKRRALKRLDAKLDHLYSAKAEQESKPRFANKAKTVALKPAKVQKKAKSFNHSSIAAPVGEFDMSAYERKCREEQKEQDRKDAIAATKVRFDIKQVPMTKEQRQEMAKNANEFSKARVKFRKAHPEAKDAKESAFWLRKLLTEQEIAQQKLDARKQVMNLKPKTAEDLKSELDTYRGNIKGVYRKFTAADKLYEIDRRRMENAKVSEALGHPALKSAAVFDDGIMAAQAIINADPAEMGCKWLFKAIELRKDSRDELYIQLEDAIALREAVIRDHYDASQRFVECAELGGGNDLDSYRQIIDKDDANFKELCGTIREMRKQIANLKAELKTLNSALKEIRKNADPAQGALIDARAKVAARKAKNRHDETFGRPVLEADKPVLLGYKAMHFKAKSTTSVVSHLITKINAAGLNVVTVMNDVMSTDDEKDSALKALEKTMKESLDELKRMKNAGKKIRVRASEARIHNSRQSQLTDTIGVPYGKTTDMIITMSHDVANVIIDAVRDNLEDPTMIDEFMEGILALATDNGIEVEMLPINGKSRVVEYDFWNSNNSQLKVGKFVALSHDAYVKASEVGHAGYTDEQLDELACNGSDLLKWESYATTPGCPLEYNGVPLTVNDVLVVPSISAIRKFRNVLRYNDDGSCELHDIDEIERTMFDGELLFLVPIRSQQLRGGFAFKGFGTCIAYEDGTTMIDEIARREGLTIPNTIRDIDGIERDWRQYKVICTADCWKWAGWRFGGAINPSTGKIEGGKRFTYAEYCARMNKLAEKYPAANKLYTARIADATEESKRRLTRQSMQQFIFATHAQIERLAAKSVGKLHKWSTHDGVIRVLAGLDKPEDERTAFEHLVEVSPEILDHPLMKRSVEDMFNRAVAEAAVRPEVSGIYPYLAEDPVALIKIVFWKMDPNKPGLGYLKGSQVNAPQTKEGVDMYVVRYPNNYLCGRIRKNHNDDIYRCVGNVLILSVDGGLLIIADGDSDGDEMCCIFDEVVVEMMGKVITQLKPPMIAFPHGGLKKTFLRGKKARAEAIAKAMVIANMYGPEVGKNSNLATKFMNKASVNYVMFEKTGLSEYKWKFNKNLENAIVAHIAAIIAIDLAKTGEMPDWLEGNLNKISKFAGKKMPWNQRFCKDNKSKPWFSAEWDEDTLAESESVVDRFARFVIDAVDAEHYKTPTGDNFDIHSLLGSKLGLDTRGSKGKLNPRDLRALDARNYREKNDEGDDEYKIVELLKSTNPDDKVGPTELIRFLWRNQASLVYVMQKEGSDRLDNARMQNSYYEFCHDLLIDFGSFCGNERFAALDADVRRKSNIYKYVEMAFDINNTIGKELPKIIDENGEKQLCEEALSKKASFCMFTVKVFAYDMYLWACEQKGITSVWVKPVNTAESSDVTDHAESEGDIYGDTECAA